MGTTTGIRGGSGWEARRREVFLGALDREGAARAGYLDGECAGDPELRRAVDELIAHDGAAAGFMTGDAGARMEMGADGAADVPAQIGPYRLVRLLGEGGFGVVYLAEQVEPVARRVAIKLIRPGVGTREVVRRFMLERRALAVMDHPCIAKVFDAGATADGRPYFVMEYVEGARITGHCDRERMSVRERVGLMIEVCRAVEHAHQRGIIHRDLKPSNILVASVDGRAMARVIDFGVAKAVAGEGRGAGEPVTLAGQGGAGLPIGTPEYMSPEQAGGSAVDTRTDVYALGVVLYELLAGLPPFEEGMEGCGGREELLQRIREREPASPGKRLSGVGRTGDGGARAGTIAGNRGTTPLMLVRQLRGELGWIPLKAMAKEPEKRYGSAAELAEDLERYLGNRALRAGPPSRVYLARKLIRRRRVEAVGAAAVACALMLGVLTTARENVRARASARAADDQRAEAETQAYVANLTAAAAGIAAEDSGVARKALLRVPEGVRGWEWGHLWGRLGRQVREDAVPRGITFLTATPDGGRLIESLSDGTVRVREVETGAVRWSEREGKHTLALACSRDGRLMVHAPGDVLVREVETGRVVLRRVVGDEFATGARFTVNGARVVVGDCRGVVRCIEVEGGGVVWEKRTGGAWVWAIDVGPDGREVAFGDGRRVVVCDAMTGAEKRGFTVGSESAGWRGVRDVRYSPEGDRLAVAAGVTVSVIDAADGHITAVLRGHTQPVTSAVFDERGGGGAVMATISQDRTLRTWDAATGAPLSVQRGHTEDVVSAAFVAGGRLATSSLDGTVRVWDARPRPDVKVLASEPRPNETGRRIGFGAGGEWLMIAATGRMEYLDMGADRLMVSPIELEACRISAISPTEKTVVVGGSDGSVRMMELETGRTRWTVHAHAGAAKWTGFSGDGRAVISSGGDGSTVVLAGADGKELARREDGGVEYLSAYLTPDGSAAVVLRDTDRLVMWDWKRGEEAGATRVLDTEGDEGLLGIGVSGDGKRVACASLTGTIRVWEVGTGRMVAKAAVQGARLRGIAFSPDGSRIAVCAYDGMVRVLDGLTLRELLALRGHEAWVDTAAWSPDGRWLASVDWDGTVRVWDGKGDAAR